MLNKKHTQKLAMVRNRTESEIVVGLEEKKE